MATPAPARIGVIGRQPVIDYLTKDYAGFRQAMLDQIPLLFPRWTDRGEADLGVVLIELFAYVADILSYYQDRVANESFLHTATQRRSVAELLRLIGYQIDPGLSASALIHFDCTADLTVAGTDLPYRVKTAPRPGEADVTFEILEEFTVRAKNSKIEIRGPLAASTTRVLVDADHELVEGDLVYFEQEAIGNIPFRRSPRLTVTSVTPISEAIDEIHWLPPLSETLESPTLALRGNNVPATHGETVRHEPVFVGDGTPAQRFTLSRTPVSHRIHSEPLRRRSAAALEIRVNGAAWQEVSNFFDSAPHDTHYTTSIDESDHLTVTFGTGRRGSVPPADAEVTSQYRIGLGVAGNVTADALTVPDPNVGGIRAVTNPFPAAGGADRESTDEAKISGPGSVIAQDRAVTLEDHRLLALSFPGVAKARARIGLRGGYKIVQIFIVPQGASAGNPVPAAPDLKQALKRHLEDRMPVNRMAGVEVFDAVYVPVDVTVAIHLRPDGSRSQVQEQARRIVIDALSLSRREFGEPVRAGELFAALFPIEGVAFVQLERLMRGGTEPPPTHECAFADVPIADHEIAVEGRVLIKPIGGLA